MSPAATFALWGCFLAALVVVGAVVWGFPDPESPALLGGAAGVIWLLAAFVALRRLGVPRLGTAAASPSLSPPTVWLGISLTLLALSVEVGLWLSFIGGGMVGVGLAGLLREWISERRALERAQRAHGAAAARRAED